MDIYNCGVLPLWHSILESTRTHFRNGSMDFLGSFMKLSRLVVVQHHVIYPFGTYGLVHQPKYQSLKPLDGFFSVWSSVELSRLAVVQCLAHLTNMGLPMCQSLYLWDHWVGCLLWDLWAEGCCYSLNACYALVTIITTPRWASCGPGTGLQPCARTTGRLAQGCDYCNYM